MFKDLKTFLILRSVRRATRPRVAFRRALDARLASEMSQKGVRVGFWASLRPQTLALPLTIIGLIVLCGTGSYAYASETVVDGHPLYGLRRTVEQLEDLTVTNPQKKAELELRRVDRRLKEVERILRTRPALVAPTLRAVEDNLDNSVDAMTRLSPERQELLIQKISEQDDSVTRKMQEFSNNYPRVTRRVLQQRIGKSVDSLQRQVDSTTEPGPRKTLLEKRLERRTTLLRAVSAPILD